jgi:hypothetical protein
MKKLLALILPFLLVISCSESSDSRFDSGYSDGYASGYNTTCKIRATMIEGYGAFYKQDGTLDTYDNQ